MEISIEAELAAVDALLLSGSDEPVEVEALLDIDDDDFAVAPPPHSISVAVSEDRTPDMVGVIVIEAPTPEEIMTALEEDYGEIAPSPAPTIKLDRKDRVSAFVDRIAEDRARALLGDSFFPIVACMAEAPKKVADKVYNALCHVAGRGKLSAYTVIGVKALQETPVLTASILIQRFKEAGYTEATAKSQAHQQMATLSILGIGCRTDAGMFLDADSVVLALMNGLPAPVQTSPAPQPDDADDDADLLAAVSTACEDEALLFG